MEDQLLKDVPAWLKWLGGGLGGAGAALLFMRQWLSQAKVDRTANEANVATILRQQEELRHERDRNDALMREREEMARKIGSLEGEVKGLRDQIEMLTRIVREIKGEGE